MVCGFMSRTARTRDRTGIYKDQIYSLITIYKTGISFYNSSITVLDKEYKNYAFRFGPESRLGFLNVTKLIKKQFDLGVLMYGTNLK